VKKSIFRRSRKVTIFFNCAKQTRKPSWCWHTRATQNDEKIPPFRRYNKFQSSM